MAPTPELDLSVCSPIVSLKNQLQSKWNLIFSKTNETAWISFKPQLGLHVYPCYACRDMFVSKVTFQDHANRRVILIKYDCGECNQTFTFYNRCSFLLHARSHFALDEGKIDLNNIEIYNMPFGMMGFLPLPGIDILFDADEDTVEENCYINAQFYSPDENERGKQMITLRPNDLLFCGPGENSVTVQLTLKQISSNIPLCQFVTTDCQKKLKQSVLTTTNISVKEELPDPDDNSQSSESPPVEHIMQLPVISKIESLSTDALSTYPKCPECKQTQRCPMQMHFMGRNIPFDENLKCSLCKYVSSTRCSHSAHQRIHSNIAPFICPECGKKFESREYLMKHLDDVCFHLAKTVRIRCPGKKCGKLFATPTTFSVHFTQHIRSWQQCNICKKSYENMLDFSEHAKIHSNTCIPKRIFKCLGCAFDGCIIFEDNIKQHLDYHTADRSRYMYVFVCNFCRNYFRSTATYAAHLLKCQKMPAMRKHVNSYAIDLCVQCHSRIVFYDDESIVTCSRCKHVNSLHQNQNESSNTSSSIQSIEESNIPRVEVCLLCREEYPIDQKEEHQSKCMYRTPQVVVERLQDVISQCAITSSDDTAVEYENKEASDKKSSSDSDMKDTSMEQTDTDCSLKLVKNASPTSQDGLKKKRKKSSVVCRSKKVILSSPPGKIIDLQAEEAKPFDGTYYCKMCDFQENNRDEFHLHITTHRHIPTDYQCMECGECFVVKPSLIKHLKHYHKIEDTNSYLENNNCYDKNAVDELKEIMKLAPGESRDPVKENQCRVCLQEFPDEPELKKHFRMHGMAFLLRNSRDGA